MRSHSAQALRCVFKHGTRLTALAGATTYIRMQKHCHKAAQYRVPKPLHRVQQDVCVSLREQPADRRWQGRRWQGRRIWSASAPCAKMMCSVSQVGTAIGLCFQSNDMSTQQSWPVIHLFMHAVMHKGVADGDLSLTKSARGIPQCWQVPLPSVTKTHMVFKAWWWPCWCSCCWACWWRHPGAAGSWVWWT